MPTQTKLSNFQKLNYAMGDFSSNIMFAAINFYWLYFMINVGGLSPFYASAVFFLTKLSDGITDYLMGLICDYTMARRGSRRMYMLVASLPLGLFFPLLWLVPNTSMQFYKFLYYFILYSVFDTIWTVVFIPYNSLLANMTDDYDERTSLNGWRVSIANTGMILGSALFPLFADGAQSFFYQIFGNEKDAYFFSSLIFGIIAGVLMFVCAFKVQERPCVAQAPRVAPWKTLKEFFSMKEFRSTLLHYTSAMTGIDVVMGIYIFYLSDVVGITNGVLLTLFLSIPLITATIATPFWVKLSAQYSKHRMYVVSAVGIVIALLSTLFIPKNGYLPLSAFCVMSGFFMAALQILPFAAIPDVVEVDEYKHGVRREGSYFGVVQFSYNTASGIAMALVSLLLGIFGYIENVSGMEVIVQPASALFAVRGILAFMPSALFLLSACFSRQINMNREKFNDMKKETASRRE